MAFETTIPTKHIKLEKLEGLVSTLSEALQAPAVITTQFVITTDNTELSDILDNFAVNLEQRHPKPLEDKERKRAKRGSKSHKAPKPADAFGPNSYRIVATGEIHSTRVINNMLADGQIEDNTVLEKVDGRRFVALDGKLIKEP